MYFTIILDVCCCLVFPKKMKDENKIIKNKDLTLVSTRPFVHETFYLLFYWELA